MHDHASPATAAFPEGLRLSAQGSDPESFPSSSAAVLVSAACEASAPQLMRQRSHAVPSDDHSDADAAKLVRAAPTFLLQPVVAILAATRRATQHSAGVGWHVHRQTLGSWVLNN